MSHPKTGPLAFIGALLLALDAIRLLLEWRVVRWVLEMFNLGGAVDFALTHWQNPGWLASPAAQFLIIVVGFALILWDRKRPTWLPSPEIGQRPMIISGIAIIILGAVIVGIGLFRQSPSDTIASAVKPADRPKEQSAPSATQSVNARPATQKRVFMRDERNRAIASIVAAQKLLKETTKETLDKSEAVLSEMQKDGPLNYQNIDERIKAFESSLQKQTGAMASFRYAPEHHDLNIFGIDMSWNNDTHSMQFQVQMADAELRRYLGEVQNRFGSLEWRYIQDSVNLQAWKNGAVERVRGWASGHDGVLQKTRERWENVEVAD